LTQDYAEAVKWFHRAAEQGDPDAAFNLGCMYWNGQGVPQDYVQAHVLFNHVAKTATEPEVRDRAVKHRDGLAMHMTPLQIAEAHGLFREWIESHAS
jgi:TPR repeat protein